MDKNLPDAWLFFGPTVEFLGVGAEGDEAEALGNERGKKQGVQVAGEIGDGRSDGDGNR